MDLPARKNKVPTCSTPPTPPAERPAEQHAWVSISPSWRRQRAANDTGLLLGRKDLIEAAEERQPALWRHGPHEKVGKEDMIAVPAAERFVRIDVSRREFECKLMSSKPPQGPNLKAERVVPPIANHVPHVVLTWDEKRVRITPTQVTRKLADGDPPIQLGRVRGTGETGLLVSVLTLQDGEEKMVGERLQGVLRQAAK